MLYKLCIYNIVLQKNLIQFWISNKTHKKNEYNIIDIKVY